MRKNPLITIICLCYNHEKYVIESLESVIKQTYSNFELIIVDDCSTDNSSEKIKKWIENYPQYLFIENKINLGNTKSFNLAKKSATGTYILDLAADDFLEKDALQNLITPFIDNDSLGIVYGNSKLIDKDAIFISYYYNLEKTPNQSDYPQSGYIYEAIVGQKFKINSVASLIKKEVFDILNAYDENLEYEDLDLWIRASRIYPFAYINKVIINKRELKNSLGNQFYKPFNKKTKALNRTSYLIIKKAIALNQTKAENKSLMKRLHYEMDKAMKTYDIILFLKYIPLEFTIRFHRNLKKEN